MRVVRVARNVFAFLGEGETAETGWGANQAAVIGRKHVLVVDTCFSPQRARSIISRIRSITRKPIRFVVNTHYHSDHVFGNQVFQNQGATVLAHKNCARRIHQEGDERIRNYQRSSPAMRKILRGLRQGYPDVELPDGARIDLGGVGVELIPPDRMAHTSGDTMVWCPEARTLIAGDVLWNQYHPNLEDWDYEGWLKTLDMAKALNAHRIIPGHGPIASPENLDMFAEYLTRFHDAILPRVTENLGENELVTLLGLEACRNWKMLWILERNIQQLRKREYSTSPHVASVSHCKYNVVNGKSPEPYGRAI